MKHIKVLLLFIIICSCKTDVEKNDHYSMYVMLIDEFTYSNGILQEQITESLTNRKLTDISSVKTYDSLTKQYLNYLDKTYSGLISSSNIKSQEDYSKEFSKTEHINDLFFVGNDYGKVGTEFITQMDNYRNEIIKLIDNKNLAKRINGILDTRDITNREGKKVKHLNYQYKDMPLVSVLTFLKHKEKCVLEFENEYLKNIELNN